MAEKNARVSLDAIRQFLGNKHIAIVGVSRDPKKFGNAIFKEMIKSYTLYPVHPELKEVEGVPCYANIASLPQEVEAIVINTKPENTLALLDAALDKNIRQVWLQQGAQSEEAIGFGLSHNMNLIYRQCILMFANPVSGIHKFHRGINRFFGVYPK